MKTTHSFPKKNKLKSRKKLQEIFAEGKRVQFGAVRGIFLVEEGEALVRCGVGASRRNFRHAVDRNRIKRLLREAYRLQQAPLQELAATNNTTTSLFLMYQGKELPTFEAVKEDVQHIILKAVMLQSS